MEDSVRAYADENPRLNYAAIVARFGYPRVVAESCVEEMETAELVKNLRVRRKIVCIVAAAALVMVLMWAGVVAAAWLNHLNSANGYFVERIVNVTNIPDEEG